MNLPDCIFCGKEIEMGEIFLAHIKKDMESITHFQCRPCGRENEDNRLDKNGGKWILVKLTLDGIVNL